MSQPNEPGIASSAVTRFAHDLLAAELPALPPDRRADAVGFVVRRVESLPSIMRFGVSTIGLSVDAVGALVGHGRMRGMITRLPLPLLAEYPRLVRSLGFAYVWETWPDTLVDGGSPT